MIKMELQNFYLQTKILCSHVTAIKMISDSQQVYKTKKGQGNSSTTCVNIVEWSQQSVPYISKNWFHPVVMEAFYPTASPH